MYDQYQSFYFLLALRGSVFTVPKGPVTHKGILHSVQLTPHGVMAWVLDNSAERGCVAIRSLAEFCGGQPWKVLRRAEPWEADAIINRGLSELHRRYDLWNFNCEHFVTLAVGINPQSDIDPVKEVFQAAFAVAGVVGAVALTAKALQAVSRG